MRVSCQDGGAGGSEPRRACVIVGPARKRRAAPTQRGASCSSGYGLIGVPRHHCTLRPEPEDREVQVRRVGWRVAGGADVADDVAGMHARAFAQVLRVAIEMRVVVREAHVGIELVDGEAAGHAVEQLRDAAVVHGARPAFRAAPGCRAPRARRCPARDCRTCRAARSASHGDDRHAQRPVERARRRSSTRHAALGTAVRRARDITIAPRSAERDRARARQAPTRHRHCARPPRSRGAPARTASARPSW